jgi:phospholipase D1/2
MDDQPYKAGLYASSLRKQLFREHLGITGSDVDIRDPVADSFYKGTWIRIASLNTKIYEDVFRCVPSDSATSFARLRAFQAQFPLAFTEPQAAQHKLTQIQVFT